jgi:hypothetical protein
MSSITPYFHADVFFPGIVLVAVGIALLLRARWISRQLISTWTEAGLPRFLLLPLPVSYNEKAAEVYQRSLATVVGVGLFLMGCACLFAALYLPEGRHQ